MTTEFENKTEAPKTETTATPAPSTNEPKPAKSATEGKATAGDPKDKAPEVNSIYEHEAAKPEKIEDYDEFRANQPDHLAELGPKTAAAKAEATQKSADDNK